MNEEVPTDPIFTELVDAARSHGASTAVLLFRTGSRFQAAAVSGGSLPPPIDGPSLAALIDGGEDLVHLDDASGHLCGAVIRDAIGSSVGVLGLHRTDACPGDQTERSRLLALAKQVQRILDLKEEHLHLREVGLVLKESAASLGHDVRTLEGQNRELNSFADFTAHELKAPLRSVSMYAELLNRELESNGPAYDRSTATEYLAQIHDGAARMSAQVDGLLALARLGEMAEQPMAVDLNEVAATALSHHQRFLCEIGAAVSVEPLPTVLGSEHQLLSVVGNLISNAIRYRHDERSLTLVISGGLSDGMARIMVQDNGVGLAADNHEKIFDMFGRVDRNIPGVGLGLAICRRIIELAGGEVGVESTPGEGAGFWFTVPAV